MKKDSIQSDVLKQNRKINIYLPEGYDAKDVKFPVLYVLDADGRDQHTVPTARFLFLNNKMPKAIVVGVFNIDRNHDFLPDSSLAASTGGGADNFLKFFKTDLIPYINKNFKTEPFNVLIGHSYGGVFVMHALLNDPDLFDAYIAIDPSFWYKKEMQVKSAQIEFQKNKTWNKPIFISGRDGGGMKGMGITSMKKVLKTSAPAGLKWKIVAYPNEDHGSGHLRVSMMACVIFSIVVAISQYFQWLESYQRGLRHLPWYKILILTSGILLMAPNQQLTRLCANKES